MQYFLNGGCPPFLTCHGGYAIGIKAPSNGLKPLVCKTLPEDAVLSGQQQTHYEVGTLNQSDPELASITSSIVPNDTHVDKQWALRKIQALDAWQVTSDSQDILIAVLDTGIDQAHIDLAGKVTANVNFTESPTFDDVHGHGTHVAGIIGAIANNSTGIAGLAYNCSLMNVKVTDDRGSCDALAVAEGIVWAVNNGANVINISLEIREPSLELEEAVNYAWSQGSLIVVAAGNDGSESPAYPAYYENCIAVAATNQDDHLAPLSNHGDWVDVAAPGWDIYSTLPDNEYGYKSGTSFACPYVSGMAALLFNVVTDTNGNGRLNDEVRAAIEAGCQEIDVTGVGGGRIDVTKAMDKVNCDS